MKEKKLSRSKRFTLFVLIWVLNISIIVLLTNKVKELNEDSTYHVQTEIINKFEFQDEGLLGNKEHKHLIQIAIEEEEKTFSIHRDVYSQLEINDTIKATIRDDRIISITNVTTN